MLSHVEVWQGEKILPERRYQLRHQLRQPHGPESRCRLLHDQRVLCLRGRRCHREAVGARLLGVGRCMQRGPDAQAALGRYGAAPVLRVERTAGLQRAGGGAAGRQVLPDRHDLLVGDLRRALDELLGLRGEPEPSGLQGFSSVLGAAGFDRLSNFRVLQVALDSSISDPNNITQKSDIFDCASAVTYICTKLAGGKVSEMAIRFVGDLPCYKTIFPAASDDSNVTECNQFSRSLGSQTATPTTSAGPAPQIIMSQEAPYLSAVPTASARPTLPTSDPRRQFPAMMI